ncbi:MAG TPA: cytochrome c oxidase assembly protein [Acidimicrobiales bacterium]|jgi:putative membrane protein
MKPAGHPLDWHLHVIWYLVLVGVLVAYIRAVRRPEFAVTRRQRAAFVSGLVLVLAAVTWPLADIAAHWSLIILVIQRLLLMLAVPPLLVAGLPEGLIIGLTKPRIVDGFLRIAEMPVPAVAFVTVVAVGTLTTGAVNLASRSAPAQAGFELLVLIAGIVLWAPVLSRLPGAPHLSSLGRGGYLIVQSIVPSFLSFVWIFAKHSLYAPFAHRGRLVGISPLLDQQLAGFLAKVGTIAVLWTVAFVIMNRGQIFSGADDDRELTWRDVQREIERADRRDRHHPPPPA